MTDAPENETADDSEDNLRNRKRSGWLSLGGATFTSCFLLYDVLTGVA